MRSAVDRLLQQSLELGRIEAAHQEKETAMRTNKVLRVASYVLSFSTLGLGHLPRRRTASDISIREMMCTAITEAHYNQVMMTKCHGHD